MRILFINFVYLRELRFSNLAAIIEILVRICIFVLGAMHMEAGWPMQEDSHDDFGVLKLQLLLRTKGKCACEFVHFEFLNWCSEYFYNCGMVCSGVVTFQVGFGNLPRNAFDSYLWLISRHVYR